MRTIQSTQKTVHRPRGAVALALIEARRITKSGLLYLSAGEREAENLGADIHKLYPDCPVMVLPRWGCLPCDPSGPYGRVEAISAYDRVSQRITGTLPDIVVDAASEPIGGIG